MNPMASKPAYLPVLKNTGRVDCRDSDGDDDEGGKDNEDEEELPPSLPLGGGAGAAYPGGAWVHPRAACG